MNPRGHKFNAGYVPLSALTGAEQREYLNILANYKQRLSPELCGSNAFRQGIRQRIIADREPTNPTTEGGVRRRA